MVTACGTPSQDSRNSTEASAEQSPLNCAAVWQEIRDKVTLAGEPDGEARRQADLARAECEGLSLDEYPAGARSKEVAEQAQGEEDPKCASESDRREAPPPDDSSSVAVYFSCKADMGSRSEPVYMHVRVVPSDDRDIVQTQLDVALRAYLEGPTEQESQRGYTTALSGTDGALLEAVMLRDGAAIISFSPEIERFAPFATTAGQTLIGEIRANAFQFSQINNVRLEVAGDCSRFWRMLESECQVLHR